MKSDSINYVTGTTNVGVKSNDSNIYTWQAVEGAQGYTVFCSETPTGGYEKVLSCGSDATQATVRVDPDSEKPNVYFKVRAYSKDTGSKNVVYRSECSAEPGVIVMWTEEN